MQVENAILKILLTDFSKAQLIFENCENVFFENYINRSIFKTAKMLYDDGNEIDNIIIVKYLKIDGLNDRLEEILIETEAYSFRVKKYCQILFERYLNKLIKNAKTIEDLEQINDLKQKYTFEKSVIKHISDGIENFEKDYEKKRSSFVITGWNTFDRYIGSFCGGDYIALGGSTGTGKTTLALNIAKNVCIMGKKVLYFSLEMTHEQLRNRFNCMIEGLDARKYRSSEGFTKEEFEKYKVGLSKLYQWDLQILTEYNLTVDMLKYRIQELQKGEGVDFVIIDYLGLLGGYNNKSLYEKTTVNSRKIKIIATELNIPILVLVQLNREYNKRKGEENRKPILSDIRESGAIEQDADYVLFAYRDMNKIMNDDEMEIIIAKNRHGISNKVIKMGFDLKTQEIWERAIQ